jgi:hypothetical protein
MAIDPLPPREKQIDCHPGKISTESEKRGSRFPSFSFVLQPPKMAARPCAAGNANRSAFPKAETLNRLIHSK